MRSEAFRRSMLSLVFMASAAAAVLSAASAKAKPRCPAASNIVAENRVARVFTRPFGYGDKRDVDLVGCWKGHGRTVSVMGPGEGCTSRGTFKFARLRGRFVAAYIEARTRSHCVGGGTLRSFVNVADLRSRAKASYEIPGRPAADRLLLNTKGMVVWPSWLSQNQVEVLVPYGVELPWDAPNGPGGLFTNIVRAIGNGAIHPESVRLSSTGLVSWVNEGAPGAFQIGRDRYPPP